MQSEIVKHFQLASPDDIIIRTGIKNWESRSQSYTKSLYNNTLLPYDDHAVYCMDKLHLMFQSLNQNRKQDYRSIFRSKQQYDINQWITIIPDNKRQSYYNISFTVIVEDNHFGRLHLFHNRNNQNCLLEIDNEVLYCQPSGWIIAGVFAIAKAVDLQFNNISIIEIARDSNDNTYKQLTNINYQSTHCSSTIHELHGDNRFYKAVTKCKYDDSPDENDPSEGVFRIGKSSSSVFCKAYNKTKEIKDKRLKKHYIKFYHDTQLDPTKNVYRVEMTADSGAFYVGGILGKRDIDLLYLLDKSNFPVLFFALLGDKMVFKDLRTKRWFNGNDIYDTVSIIPEPTYIRTREIPTKPLIKKYTHDRNINQTKQMINQYLDDHIGYSSLRDYCIRGMREDKDFAIEFRSALNMVKKNHKNKITKRDNGRLEKLCTVLRKSMEHGNSIRLRVLFPLLL